MANVTPSQSQVGRLSFSATYTAAGATDTIQNAALLACCEQGPLYNFFAASYATKAEIIAAWADAGGLISVQSDASTTPKAYFDLSAGKAIVQLAGAAAAEHVSIRFALSYSASR